MSVKPEWKQGPDCAGLVGINHGLIFSLRVEALKQVVRVEIEGECYDLIYGWKNWELIERQ